MARHSNKFLEARNLFREQGRLARKSLPSIKGGAEICRAAGNEGMAIYNLWQKSEPRDDKLLKEAFDKIEERITRARALQERLLKEAPQSKYTAMAHSWETIGMDRLTLCHIAAGDTAAAVRVAAESQRKQTRKDPSVTAFSRCLYGNALWHDGQREAAVKAWNAPAGTFSSPMALCKEPGAEYNEYLRLMAKAGVDFDSYDEQGFSALDHAVLSDSPEAWKAIPIVEDALRQNIGRNIREDNPALSIEEVEAILKEEIAVRRRQAELRRQYRTLLQEHIRPKLRTKADDTFTKLREIYAEFLFQGSKERRMFSHFNYVRYTDFKQHGRLPISTAGLTQQFSSKPTKPPMAFEPAFIIFLSYRWIGGNVPDNDDGKQWHRMIGAVEEFLKVNPNICPETLGLWLDYACIDQEDWHENVRGVDALPLAVTQCNAMISLVDEIYYKRAWCAVEVTLMRALMGSYGLHQWWEYVDGSLRKGSITHTFDIDSLKLTKEKMDRPKIDFLLRQSKLLGRDKV